ncbi:hypothetical protein OG601_46975 [Streptomyces sp. NBC_01239]|uniref:hypothetical protein n=1 Tax=Streptomyces sp. NBC_01239 TaxID=2903792 RepID=UPI002256D091|nr:hypothetical protein [Streptomyces sp. NBC_01239]MCX4809065.1 hypothetical protein [Streptomyces sp. NBC_01239]MCX4818118.1 hypothetical protein [Streptomyces sp. NBC_01239]
MSVTLAIDLADLTGMPDGPLPDRDTIDDWSLKSFDDYFTATARHSARRFAAQAAECEATGRWMRDWHSCREAGVLSLLAAAEQAAPEEDRVWYATRLDAYVELHGLRGWHRYTDFRGKHCIQINLIRKREDGERGRHYVHAADRMHGPLRFWVVDRDTHRTVYRSFASGIARQWIDERENTPTDSPVGVDPQIRPPA